MSAATAADIKKFIKSMCFKPTGADMRFYVKGNRQGYRIFHLLTENGKGFISAVLVCLDDQLVVYLQYLARVQPTLGKTAVYADHGDLDNIGGSSLNGAVHSDTLAEFLAHFIGLCQLGDETAAACDGGHVAVFVCR